MNTQKIDNSEKVKNVTEEFLKNLEIESSVDVVIDETNAYRVQIDTEETGLLIGNHGRTLESFQIILGIMVARKLGSWDKVYVNVGDYRQKREEALMNLSQRAADQAISSGKIVELSRLSASERRVVHLTLSGDERVETESEGERDRRILLVKPK